MCGLQPIGSTCFILQGLLCMLEVQRTWWGIKPLDLGWHVGLWNLIGGVGFWLRCHSHLPGHLYWAALRVTLR